MINCQYYPHYKSLKTINDIKTRMTTFIKTKFNKFDDQTNIDNIHYLQILQNIILSENSYQRHLDSEGLTTLHKIAT